MTDEELAALVKNPRALSKTEFAFVRGRAGFSIPGLAEAFEMGKNGERTIRRWEEDEGSYAPPGAACIALLALAGAELDKLREIARRV